MDEDLFFVFTCEHVYVHLVYEQLVYEHLVCEHQNTCVLKQVFVPFFSLPSLWVLDRHVQTPASVRPNPRLLCIIARYQIRSDFNIGFLDFPRTCKALN